MTDFRVLIPFMFFLTIAAFAVLIYLNKKEIFLEIKKIKRPVEIALWIIFIAAFLLRVFTPWANVAFPLEQQHMLAAKSLLSSGRIGFSSVGWPMFIAGSFLFGMNNYHPIAINIVLGSLTIFLMFFLGRLLTKKSSVGLISALIVALLPFHIHWSATGTEAISASFFFLLALTSIFFFIRYNSLKTFALASASIGLAMQFLFEAALLWLILGLALLLYSLPFLKKQWFPIIHITFLGFLLGAFTFFNSFYRTFINQQVAANVSTIFNGLTLQSLFLILFIALGFFGMLYYKFSDFLFFAITAFLIVIKIFFTGPFPFMYLFFILFCVILASIGIEFGSQYLSKVTKIKSWLFIILALILVLAVGKPMIHNEDMFYLETMMPSFVSDSFSPNCLMVMIYPEILMSNTNFLATGPETFMALGSEAECIYFIDDLMCKDEWDRPTQPLCTKMKETYNLKKDRSLCSSKGCIDFYKIVK